MKFDISSFNEIVIFHHENSYTHKNTFNLDCDLLLRRLAVRGVPSKPGGGPSSAVASSLYESPSLPAFEQYQIYFVRRLILSDSPHFSLFRVGVQA